MRILFLNHNVKGKGGYFRAYYWGKYLVKMGHSVTIITISAHNILFSKSYFDSGIKIVESPDLFYGKLRTGWDIFDTIFRIIYVMFHQYDVIHCVDTRPNVIVPGLIKKFFNNKIALIEDWGDWWGRGGTISERKGGILEKMFEPIETFWEEAPRKFADGIIPLTEPLYKRCIQMKIPQNRLKIVRHGVEYKQSVNISISDSKLECGFSKNDILFGYVGTIFPADASLVLNAFKDLLEEYPKVKLIFIGNSNFNFPPELIAKNKIFVTGRLSKEKLVLYESACDAMLLPLRNTIANNSRWPSKACDYLALGKPIISTNVSDIATLIRENNCGIIAESDDNKSYKRAMEEFIHSQIKSEMSKNAFLLAKELSWEKQTKILENFYVTLLN